MLRGFEGVGGKSLGTASTLPDLDSTVDVESEGDREWPTNRLRSEAGIERFLLRSRVLCVRSTVPVVRGAGC